MSDVEATAGLRKRSEVPAMISEIGGAFVDLAAAAREMDWETCEASAARTLGVGYGAYRAAMARAADSNRAFGQVSQSKALFDDLMEGAERDSDTRSALTEALSSDASDSFEAIRDELQAALEAAAAVTSGHSGNHRAGYWAIAALARGLLGLVHSNFNRGYLRASATDPQPAVSARGLRAEASAYAAQLSDLMCGVYAAAARRQPSDTISTACLGLAAWIEQTLPRFAALQAVYWRLIEALLGAGKGTEAEQAGIEAVAAGGITRDALTAHAAAYSLALELAAPTQLPESRNLLTRAVALPFSGKLPDGKNTEIAQLPTAPDGEFVEIRGFVESSRALRLSDGKLVSRLTVHDPSSEQRTEVAAIFAHLPHAGVTRGSCCRIHGFVRTASNLFESGAGVEVDKLALAVLGKKSWRIAFLRSGRRWYPRWRSGTSIDWSLTPHGPRDQSPGKQPPRGANELIFLPYFRR